MASRFIARVTVMPDCSGQPEQADTATHGSVIQVQVVVGEVGGRVVVTDAIASRTGGRNSVAAVRAGRHDPLGPYPSTGEMVPDAACVHWSAVCTDHCSRNRSASSDGEPGVAV